MKQSSQPILASLLGLLAMSACVTLAEGQYQGEHTLVRERPAAASSGSAAASTGRFKDTIILKNGLKIENVRVAVTSDSVVVTYADGRTSVLKKREVASVKRGR